MGDPHAGDSFATRSLGHLESKALTRASVWHIHITLHTRRLKREHLLLLNTLRLVPPDSKSHTPRNHSHTFLRLFNSLGPCLTLLHR